VTIAEHATRLGGKTITEYPVGADTVDPGTHAYRFWADGYDDARPPVEEQLRQYAARPEAAQTTALVLGLWAEAYEGDASAFLKALVELAPKFPQLDSLFLGDITFEECEMSWINQTNVGSVLKAFPNLQRLRVRGGQDLDIDPCDHPQLRALAIEAGGLDRGIVERLHSAALPQLEELELWLGVEDYGGSVTLDDLRPLLEPGRFPELRSLGICNSELQDAVAALVVESGVLSRLRRLDLSRGTLGDTGAEALLASPDLASLEALDLHHHYLSEPVVERLRALDLELDVSDRQQEDDWGDGEMHRYVAVSE
jgi:hypothetical protein